jgi:PHP family Zn ribbon phosphoesterase
VAHSTEQRATAQQAELDELITEAADATGILPTIERCEELRDGLRAAITDLSGQVRRRLDAADADTEEWMRLEGALLQAQGALLGGFGRGLRSAAVHVKTLGEAAEALAGCIRDD